MNEGIPPCFYTFEDKYILLRFGSTQQALTEQKCTWGTTCQQLSGVYMFAFVFVKLKSKMSRVSAEFLYVSEYIFVSEFLWVSEYIFVSEFLYVSVINCIYFQGGVKCSAVSRKVICIFIQMLSPNNPRNVIESHGAEHILMNRVPKIFINRAAFSKCRGSSPVVLEMRGLFVNFENIYFGWCTSPLEKKTKCCLTQFKHCKRDHGPTRKVLQPDQLSTTCDNFQ